jgi:Mor family transcriptional regulator
VSVSDHIVDLFKNDIFEALLASERCDEETAAELSNTVLSRIIEKWGGSELYLPKRPNREKRYAEIKQDFTGVNHQAVCKKHGISLKTLYRAISQ